jgi:sugar-specific transcriptional regulator TrmB
MKNNNKIQNLFVNLGNSILEADIYVALLEEPNINGSKLAKKINISKPSVYLALDKLEKKGYIYKNTDKVKTYVAKNPDLLIHDLTQSFESDTNQLKDELAKVEIPYGTKHFYTINDRQHIFSKIKTMINIARTEILINTNIPLSTFKNELKNAYNRGVRILVFSFEDIHDVDIEIEYFLKENYSNINVHFYDTFTMVIDSDQTITYSTLTGQDRGIYNEYKDLKNIIENFITLDIYIQQIEKLYPNIFKEVKILNTLGETAFMEVFSNSK